MIKNGLNSGLGTGLSSLLGLYEEDLVNQDKRADGNGVLEIDINKIITNPDQPRKSFNQEALEDLSKSIATHGVIQPITVTPKDNNYVIVAGERRYRACCLCGLKKIPVIIREFTEQDRKEISLIENIQREDLNAIEEAAAMRSLIEEYGLSQEVLADRLGKSRPAVTNALRLLNLNSNVQRLVIDSRLSAGHARCLVSVKDEAIQIKYAQAACDKKMSVRELEVMVNAYLNPTSTELKRKSIKLTTEIKELVSDMQRVFATKIKAVGTEDKGRISIDYYTKDDLQRIFTIIESCKNNNLND